MFDEADAVSRRRLLKFDLTKIPVYLSREVGSVRRYNREYDMDFATRQSNALQIMESCVGRAMVQRSFNGAIGHFWPGSGINLAVFKGSGKHVAGGFKIRR